MPRTDISSQELRAYSPALAEPADLASFWADTLEEARRRPLTVRFGQVDTGLRTVDSYDVAFCGYGGSWWLILDMPAGLLGFRCRPGHDLVRGRSFPPRRRIGYAMSMQPAAWPEPDPQVAAAIEAIYGSRETGRPLAVEVRDRLGQWLADEDFAQAFGTRGRPGWSPSRLALVTVLQRAGHLTGRQAAESVRTRIGWQYLLGLPWDGPGFDHTVLAGFRARVAGAGLEQVALDALAVEGLVKAGGKQRTDSTHVVAAVAALNRLELAGESVRAALEALAAGASGLAGPGRPACPASPAATARR